jgi:hypothetical protein
VVAEQFGGFHMAHDFTNYCQSSESYDRQQHSTSTNAAALSDRLLYHMQFRTLSQLTFCTARQSPLEQPQRLVHFEHPSDGQRDALTLTSHTANSRSCAVEQFIAAQSTAVVAATSTAAAALLLCIRYAASCCCMLAACVCTHGLLVVVLLLICLLLLLLLWLPVVFLAHLLLLLQCFRVDYRRIQHLLCHLAGTTAQRTKGCECVSNCSSRRRALLFLLLLNSNSVLVLGVFASVGAASSEVTPQKALARRRDASKQLAMSAEHACAKGTANEQLQPALMLWLEWVT